MPLKVPKILTVNINAQQDGKERRADVAEHPLQAMKGPTKQDHNYLFTTMFQLLPQCMSSVCWVIDKWHSLFNRIPLTVTS